MKINRKIKLIGIMFVLCFFDNIVLSDSAIVGNDKSKFEPNQIAKVTGRLNEKLFKHKGWMMVPMLLGGLLKIAATIPLILAVASIIGTLSLISSKLALLISTILAVRSFLTPSPPPKEPPPLLTADDLHDLQYLLAKQQEKQNYLASQQQQQQQQHQEIDYSNYLKMATDANMWNRKYINVPRYLSFPENYFVTTTPVPAEKAFGENKVLGNQESQDMVGMAGVHLTNELETARGRDEKWNRNSEDRIKILAAEEMAARANALLETEAFQFPDRSVGVKVTKTVTKSNG